MICFANYPEIIFRYFLFDTCPQVVGFFDHFVRVFLSYSTNLRNSTKILFNKKKHNEPIFYNYLFLNASLLDELLNGLNSSNVSWDLFERFKACCIYVGKGSGSRKFEHIAKAKKLFINDAFYYSYNAWRINMLWKLGTGICVIHFPIEVNHYEAHCREYAMIKSLGTFTLNNVIHGTAYGCMKLWNYEITDFGSMLLCSKNLHT